jgi:hypothetical protein
VAKPRRDKPRESTPAKVRLTHTVDAALAKRFRHAAVDLDLTESELFERVVALLFSGVHARGMTESVRASLLNDSPPPAGEYLQQGGAPVPTVRIPSVQNRLNDIARKAHGPIDDALDNFVSE